MPRWLVQAFLAASAALLITVWIALAVEDRAIAGLVRDTGRIEERLTRTQFLSMLTLSAVLFLFIGGPLWAHARESHFWRINLI